MRDDVGDPFGSLDGDGSGEGEFRRGFRSGCSSGSSWSGGEDTLNPRFALLIYGDGALRLEPEIGRGEVGDNIGFPLGCLDGYRPC